MGILVSNTVALSYTSSFKLPVWVTSKYLAHCPFFRTGREDSGEAHLLIKPYSIFNNISPFPGGNNIPDILFEQLLSFFEDCLEGFRIIINPLTVNFHNFKSQIFKLSVSNPKNKYVAYLSVLSNFKLPGSRPQKQT